MWACVCVCVWTPSTLSPFPQSNQLKSKKYCFLSVVDKFKRFSLVSISISIYLELRPECEDISASKWKFTRPLHCPKQSYSFWLVFIAHNSCSTLK